ncbi:MAG TPA: DUF2950 family protein [Planctomycetota bacterium]|nr:DUF2950 family protein [Planctomycetota bacterium]
MQELVAYNLAQYMYHLGAKTYASRISDLGFSQLKEMGAAHGLDGIPFHGYRFLECNSIGGRAINWDSKFALCASPVVYGNSGHLTFIMREDNRIWHKDLGRSEFVADFPADPAAAGWTLAE